MERMDINDKIKTQYCIPYWLRDEQIKHALARKLPAIKFLKLKNNEPIALVCFGPSLNKTWPQIKKFKHVMTCSGSHKFLLAKGFRPEQFKSWWHVEVDPRTHKIELLGTPRKGIVYAPSSTCHPAYFDHLLKHKADVKLWHVFENSEDAMRTLPAGQAALTGGCSVGLRLMTLARFRGFVNQHIFGMDGSEAKGQKHAAKHPNQPAGHVQVEYPKDSGNFFVTTPGFAAAAKQTFHELDEMHDVKPVFYGKGLVQAMAKDWKRQKGVKPKTIIAVIKAALISDKYREQQRKLHDSNLAFGVGGGKYANTVASLLVNTGSLSVLDYGCGKGYLAKALPFPIWEYDPAVPGKDEAPRSADIVASLDVLEHIEPDKLKYVLSDLQRCVRKVGYFVIHTGPSSKKTEDGKNAHLIQRGRAWWEKQLVPYFNIGEVIEQPPLLHFIVGPKFLRTVRPEQVVNAAIKLPNVQADLVIKQAQKTARLKVQKQKQGGDARVVG